MLTVSTSVAYACLMSTPSPRPARKRAGRYHHGDLRRALIDAAVRTIDRQGVQALTLRAVGDALGVSRTALYRHFRDKSSLLAAVAAEGFRSLRADLATAWEQGPDPRSGFMGMGRAYVRFAITHPSHYRVMFGSFRPDMRADEPCEADLNDAGLNAFQVLVDALDEQQRAGLIRRDDLRTQAAFIWASVHGIAMLAIDRQLGPDPEVGEALARYAVDVLSSGIAVPASGASC
jgi:AcrR family transcriptional regulator